jgi:predicted transcriptional regulator
MTNGSESLYVGRRSDLEILFDVVYVVTRESEPLGITYLINEVGTNPDKTKEILDICEKKGLVNSYEIGKRTKYESTPHGKESICTWLDFVYAFNVKPLLKSMYVEPLPDMILYSRLKEIMKKSWRKPNYVKSSNSKQRTPIMTYRDFLAYVNSHYKKYSKSKSVYAKYSHKTRIMEKINVNNYIFDSLKKFAHKAEVNHIEIKSRVITKWISLLLKTGEFEIRGLKPHNLRFDMMKRKKGPFFIRGNTKELICINSEGSDCVETLDNIIMEYKLTNLFYSYL